ncbi:CynX/NimT family MFS transporter [Streptomyces cavernicola]|uniref:MFS transporter n=1 Tax=Streptomyces cavernicola TaxID=3043613 RepID=A0ABT6S9V4_9ACTN|nr:MFS transporter [Streptomyces sp. B-S-A6]MDI3404945.1 MFS transporter [Streptomyces sp. B-S-A6]
MPREETQTKTQAPPRTTEPRSVSEPPTTRAWTLRLVAVGLVLAALNLRPAITSLGALLEEVRDGLGMSGTVAGVLTSVPPLCFAIFGVMTPKLTRRFGPAAVVCAGMAAIATGLAVRPFAGSTPAFLAASALALMGIAVSNILMPVIVKRWFPDRVATMTGLYSMALSLGTSFAAAATVPLTSALGGKWQTGLGLWALVAALAVLPWLFVVRERRTTASAAPAAPAAEKAEARTGQEDQAAAAAEQREAAPALPIARSRTAWALAVYFGLQATGAYITMGWMPQIFRDAGVPASTAGVLLAVTMAMGVPLAFVIPRVAGRLRNQGPIAAVLGTCGLIGYAGLFLAPAAGAWVWALVLGVSNCSFPLALTMVGMRAGTGAGVAKLSAFAQSTGYLLSIPGPLLIGVLYQHSGGWGLPIALMAGLMVPQIAVGILAGRNRTVEAELAARGAAAAKTA